MSDKDFFEIQNELLNAYEEQEEINEQDADDFGFGEVLAQRREKKKALRQRLQKYYLKDKEIDELFKIIEKAEDKMEKIKRSVDYKNCAMGEVSKMSERLYEVQNQMKEDFEKELNKVLKRKYENAKKILEERKKKKNS